MSALVGGSEDEYVYCDDESGVYALADGVGESRASRTAARLFCEQARVHRNLLKKALATGDSDRQTRERAIRLVDRVFNRAAETIYELARRKPGLGGMATTGVLLAVGPAGAVLGHVGDTRAYLLGDAGLRRLTDDHTLVDQMMDRGLIRESEQDSFSQRSVLSRTIGHTPTVVADTLWLDVSKGDSVPLCSYGMYRTFDDLELGQLLVRGIDSAVRTAASRRKGREDVSGLMVQVAPPLDAPPAMDTETKAQCIRNMPLFRQLGDPELIRVLKIVYEHRLAPGTALCQEGDPGDSIWIVYQGRLDVSKGAHHLTTIGPGGYLGELSFMDGQPRSATVTAIEPTTVLTFGRDDFRALVQRDPTLSAKMMWAFMLNLSARLRGLTSQYQSVLDRKRAATESGDR